MTNIEYARYLEEKRAQYGSTFDTSDLAPQFRRHFRTGQRLKVRRTYSGGEVHERTGTVGVTSGWKPAFLLMHRSNDSGSSDVLSKHDVVIAEQVKGKYIPIIKEES